MVVGASKELIRNVGIRFNEMIYNDKNNFI